MLYFGPMSTPHPQTDPGWRVLRPKQWFYFCSLALAGMDPATILARGGSTATGLLRAAVAVCCAAGLLGFAYGINAVADRRSDADPRKNPLSGRFETGSATVVWVVAAGTIALGLAVWSGGVAVVAAAISLVSACLYSTSLRAKRWPFIGLVFNIWIFLPLMGLALDRWSDRPAAFDLWLTTFVALLAQNQLLHESADAMEDNRAGDRTTAHFLGPTWTPVIGVGIGAVACLGVVWLALHPLVYLLGCGVITVATAILWWSRRQPGEARRLHRFACLVGGACLWAGSQAWSC